MSEKDQNNESWIETATFGAGCFWCVEAIFEQLDGVKDVRSGYSGGFVEDPSYEEVCSGNTGHAEVVQVDFDPSIIPYKDLLEVFWRTHDPTQLNRQGADIGSQYRSVIFYHNESQRMTAETYKQELDRSGAWEEPIVTEISSYENFYEAEDHHQDYYSSNPEAGYCRAVIVPKLEKFKQVFSDKLKPEAKQQ